MDKADWTAWQALMASREAGDDDPGAAMTVVYDNGFETVSSSLIALPAPAAEPRPPVWLFAAGRPDLVGYEPVAFGEASQSFNS